MSIEAPHLFMQVFSQDADILYEGGQEEFSSLGGWGSAELIRHIISTQFTEEDKKDTSTFIKEAMAIYASRPDDLYRVMRIEGDQSDWEDSSLPGEKGIITLLKFVIRELDCG